MNRYFGIYCAKVIDIETVQEEIFTPCKGQNAWCGKTNKEIIILLKQFLFDVTENRTYHKNIFKMTSGRNRE